jgi:hypothetical protein
VRNKTGGPHEAHDLVAHGVAIHPDGGSHAAITTLAKKTGSSVPREASALSHLGSGSAFEQDPPERQTIRVLTGFSVSYEVGDARLCNPSS